MADDLRRLAEAATAPGISEEARLEFTMQVFDAITPYTLLDLYAQLDAQAARIAALEAERATVATAARGLIANAANDFILEAIRDAAGNTNVAVVKHFADALARALEGRG